jgi:hypothetical protein
LVVLDLAAVAAVAAVEAAAVAAVAAKIAVVAVAALLLKQAIKQSRSLPQSVMHSGIKTNV